MDPGHDKQATKTRQPESQETRFWRHIRRVRWDVVYAPLLAYVRDDVMPADVSRKMKKRIITLADLVEYDPSTQQLTLKTSVPQPEYVAMGGRAVFARRPTRYTIAAPGEVDSIIEQVYKAPALGGFRGVGTIYKVLVKSYIGISRDHVRKLLPRMEVYRVRQKPRVREIHPQLADEAKPLSHVKMDLVDMSSVAGSNKNYNWLLNIVDMHSRFAWSIPLKSKHAGLVAHELFRWIMVEGTPQTIGCDQGKEFMGEVVELSRSMGFKLAKSLPYSSSTQGLVEVYNRTIRGMLSKATDERGSKSWLPLLHHMVGAYNRMKHSSHGLRPLEVMRGRSHLQVLDHEVARRLRLNAAKMVRMVARQNARRAGQAEFGASGSEKGGRKELHVGDTVRIRLASMRKVKAAGRMAMKAGKKRAGLGGRAYTNEKYTVDAIRKRSSAGDIEMRLWRYHMAEDEEDPPAWYLATDLLKVRDNTIPKAGKTGAIEENHGSAVAIAARSRDIMEEDVGELADMTDKKIRAEEKIREEAAAATGPVATRTRSVLVAASAARLLPSEGNQVTIRSLLSKDTDAKLLNKSIWVPGRYVSRSTRIAKVTVKRRSKVAGMYAVKLPKAREYIDVPVQVLLEYRGLDENEADTMARGGSKADALKTEVRDARLMAAAKKRRARLRSKGK